MPDKQLKRCHNRPNCVSSATDEASTRYIEPIKFTVSAAQAWETLQQALKQLPRSKIIICTEDYLHVEVRTRLCRFVDDIQCWLDSKQNCILLRSCSRLGYSDFGVNRRRLAELRTTYQQLLIENNAK